MRKIKRILKRIITVILTFIIMSAGGLMFLPQLTSEVYAENNGWTYDQSKGYWYVNMPATGEKKLTLDGSEDKVYKVFDDGGDGDDKYSYYSGNCNGYLELTAPTGCVILLSGRIYTENKYDVLSVYDGGISDSVLINAKSTDQKWESVSALSTNNKMTLNFKTNAQLNCFGLDLSVQVIKNGPHSIKVESVKGGRILSSVSSAEKGTEVTLTARPSSGYQLIDLKITDIAGNAIPVSNNLWYSGTDTAVFTMPITSVTVTPVFTNDLTTLGGMYINFPESGKEIKTVVPAGITSFKIYDDGGKDGNYKNNYKGKIELTAPEGCQFQLSGSYSTKPAHLLKIDYGIGEETFGGQGKEFNPLTSVGKDMTLTFTSDNKNGNDWGFDFTVTVIAPNAEYPVKVEPSDRGTVTVSKAVAKTNDTVSLNVTPYEGYILSDITVKDANGVDLPIDDIRWFTGQNTTSFVMPVSAVTIKSTFEIKSNGAVLCMPSSGKQTVNLPVGMTSFKVYDDGGPTGNYSDSCAGTLELIAPEGCTLSLSGYVMACEDDNDYLNITDSDGSALLSNVKCVNHSQNDISTESKGNKMTLYFHSDLANNTLGLNLNVSVISSSSFTSHNVNITSSTGGSVTASPVKAKKYETVTLTQEPKSGYVLSGISVSGSVSDLTDMLWYTGSKTATFTMLDSNVTVTPLFCTEGARFIIIPQKGKKTIAVPKSAASFKVYDSNGKNNNYSNNSNGTLCLMAPDGYRFKVTGTYTGYNSGDKLSIYDGSSETAEKLIEVTSTRNSISLEGSAQTMTFSFSSDSSGVAAGPDLNVSMVPITYTVCFHANDGSETMANQSFTYGESKALLMNTFTRENKYFEGWAESDNGPVEYADGQNVSNLSDIHGKKIDLYAKWTDLKQGETPRAEFEATGDDSGILSGLTSGKTYVVKGAASKTFTASGTSEVINNVSPGSISIVMKGDGSTVGDSPAQNITITRGNTPSAEKTDCSVLQNDNGKISGVSKDMEFRRSDTSSWTSCGGTVISGLTPGTYYVRVRASGTVLSSKKQELVIASYSTDDQVKTPVFSPAGGIYTERLEVRISCETENAQIYYTTDGSTPTAASSSYRGSVVIDKTTTLKAVALRDDMNGSQVASETYTIVDPSELHTVTVKNGNGTGRYLEGSTVTITAKEVPSGQRFDGWKTEDGISFSDATELETTFTMPGKDVVVTAVFVAMTEWEGMCGKKARYIFNPETRVLTITGSGKMQDYDVNSSDGSSLAPWRGFADKIKSLEIDGGITSIGKDTFAFCPKLESVSVSTENGNFSSVDGVLYDKEKETLIFCPPAKTGTITVPASVKSFSAHSFYTDDGSGKLYTNLDSIGFSGGRNNEDKLKLDKNGGDVFGKNYSGSCVLTAPEGMRFDNITVLPVKNVIKASNLNFTEETEWTLLQDELNKGGTVTLNRDYDYNNDDVRTDLDKGSLKIPDDTILDLSNHTLKAKEILAGGDFTIKNGTCSGCLLLSTVSGKQISGVALSEDEKSESTLTLENALVAASVGYPATDLYDTGFTWCGPLVLKKSSLTINLGNWIIPDAGRGLKMDPSSEIKMLQNNVEFGVTEDNNIVKRVTSLYSNIFGEKQDDESISRLWNERFKAFLPLGSVFDCGINTSGVVADKDGNDTYNYSIYIKVTDQKGECPETVTLKAPVYPVTVVNGTGSGDHYEDDTVSIVATEPENGKLFDRWVSSDGVIFKDALSPATTFTMPGNAVTVTAKYKDKDSKKDDTPDPKINPDSGTTTDTDKTTDQEKTTDSDNTTDPGNATDSENDDTGNATDSENDDTGNATDSENDDTENATDSENDDTGNATDSENDDTGNATDPENTSDQDKLPDTDNAADPEKVSGLVRVPFTEPGQAYASVDDNFAAVAKGSVDGVGGGIKDLTLDFSNVLSSGIDPMGLKITAISGSKFRTKVKVKDKSSVHTEGGVKAKFNKKDSTATITCKRDGKATFETDDGTYAVEFKVEKPKPNKGEGKIQAGSAPVTKTVKNLFGTSISGGKLTVLKEKVSGQATLSGNSLTINPAEKDTIKVQYQYLNKKYKMTMKVK